MTYSDLWILAIVEPALRWLGSLGTELTASLLDPQVWASFVACLSLGLVSFVLGLWVGRITGLIGDAEPRTDSFAIGLGLGLFIFAALSATVGSSGQSSFSPVAIAVVVAVVVGLRTRRRSRTSLSVEEPRLSLKVRGRQWTRVLGCAAAFVVVVGLVYGSTMAPSQRDGIQPVEAADEVFYSVLGADLARSGIESPFGPSGLDDVPGLPRQSWYHWGEIWLAAVPIKVIGLEPMLARHYVVLPLMLLAVAMLTATILRRLTGTRSRRWYLAALAAGVVLAPMPLVIGPFFGWWARGGIFTLSQYGLAAVVALLALYSFLSRQGRPTPAWSVLVGALVAGMLPAHIVVAFVGFAGVSGAWAIRSAAHVLKQRTVRLFPADALQSVAIAGTVSAATVVWGLLTGHGFAASVASDGLGPFGGHWPDSIAGILAGSGVFLAIPAAIWIGRRNPSRGWWAYVASGLAIVTGGVIWGVRVADYNTYHFLFGAIFVFGTPMAVAASWTVAGALRRARHKPLANFVVALLAFQLVVSGFAAIQRLRAFGVGSQAAIPVEILAAIRSLPATAKLAYACDPAEEVAPWEPRLLSIAAHTSRRVVPMCFEADLLTVLAGGKPSTEGNPLFALAPQQKLYPRPDSVPSESEVVAFLRLHEVEYIFVDLTHPNTLVPAAVPIAKSGDTSVLRIP